MDKELSAGSMAGNTKEAISMTRKKVMEFSSGLMEESTTDNGLTVSNMVKQFILLRKAKLGRVHGIMVSAKVIGGALRKRFHLHLRMKQIYRK